MGEKIMNGFLLALSTFYLAVSYTLSFGTFSAPKAGFLPRIIGWIATAITAYLFIQSMAGKGDAKNVKLEIDWKRFVLLVGALVLYILLLKPVGYLISSAAALFAVLKIAKVKGWVLPGAIAVIASAAFYIIFKTFLSIPLPAGILG
ncbi:MAG: tripartite tricarboxylate transporter TctB family protein [Oscillospiraceae bacterium]